MQYQHSLGIVFLREQLIYQNINLYKHNVQEGPEL